ncbi:LysM peptidoglycan-binding domain-containing protein [Tenacibaculum sp. nBUS_03]|uniref:LysM peptidoglycan-binding domain-containing protein n=1 Tax=Tenacibaculum sp. nBUS_03 TaxID=3395320 RepID=UPI003EB96C50
MKKLQFLILIGILSFTISCGQQKRYVSYKIQEGETMRDVANRLDMKTKDLLRLNPDVGRRPNANTVIVIPNPKIKTNNSSSDSKEDYAVVVEDDKPKETETTNNEQENENSENNNTDVYQTTVIKSYETHEVKPGETVYRLTKLYDISKDELCKLNPEFPEIVNNILSIGQILKVKAIEETVTVNKEEVLKQYLTHTVKSKETVFSLTRFYNITKKQLVDLNPEYPGLIDNNLSIGQLLKIKPIEDVKENEEFLFYQDSIQENASINLAFLLPFKTKEYDSLSNKKIFKNNKLANMVTDFYMGAEVAIDSLKQQGIVINSSIFDTGNRGENISQILENDELDTADVVIGPFYSNKADKVANKINAPIIFPHYSSKQKNISSSKIVKVAPEKTTYANYLTSYLKANYNGENIFLVGDGEKKSNELIKNISVSLKKHDSITTIHILKPEDGYIKRERFSNKMNTQKLNWVIITSEDKVIVADALNSMIGLPDDLAVQVFSTHKNSSYDRIDNNKLADINFTYVSTNFSDSNSDDIKLFYKKFRSKNNALPSEYAIKGFDITYDILIRLASGNDLTKTFKQGASIRIENKFDYKKKLFGSTINKGLFIIKYNKDLSLTRLK